MVSDLSDPAPHPTVRRVLIVGFMASGKSTVGVRLAERLGWEFLDFDAAVEARAELSVAEFFSQRGEEAFRALEAEVGEEALRRSQIVLAAGGGWPARAGRMESVPEDTLTVWLEVDAETAWARARTDPVTRPLLEGDEEVVRERMDALLQQREPFYACAHLHLDATHASPDALVDAIVKILQDPMPDAGP